MFAEKKEKIRSVYKIYITKHFFIRERNVAKTLSEMFPINVEQKDYKGLKSTNKKKDG